ncbi:hypothetical protein KQH43_24095, partial [Streptomyces sp. EL5]|uniref:HGxxPAAW family protein n=1 Tax=Streptomyces sp. EL5 TaxID=2841665 RepID=UPI00209583A7
MSGSSHGHTLAAWTGVIISFIGFCVAGVFMVMANVVGFWAGMVITVAGAVVGGELGRGHDGGVGLAGGDGRPDV